VFGNSSFKKVRTSSVDMSSIGLDSITRQQLKFFPLPLLMVRQKAAQPAVEIDNRLTDLFQSRREATSTKEVGVADSAEVPTQEGGSGGDSWLTQFKQSLGITDAAANTQTKHSSSTYWIEEYDVRPFWVSEDVKVISALWKRNKTALAKDCQKQRKAALRKTIRRAS
jgi:hypothetical protein